jgi:hypothetical protein
MENTEYISKQALLSEIVRQANRSTLGETAEPELSFKEVICLITDMLASDVVSKSELDEANHMIKILQEYIDGYKRDLHTRSVIATEPRAEGDWVVVYEHNQERNRKEARIACSVCGHKPKYDGYLADMNFCPKCGVKMGVDQD